MTLKHINTCWCKTQEHPEIYKHDKKKHPNLIHFTCSKCNAHVIIHSKLLDGISVMRNGKEQLIIQDNDRCWSCQ